MVNPVFRAGKDFFVHFPFNLLLSDIEGRRPRGPVRPAAAAQGGGRAAAGADRAPSTPGTAALLTSCEIAFPRGGTNSPKK